MIRAAVLVALIVAGCSSGSDEPEDATSGTTTTEVEVTTTAPPAYTGEPDSAFCVAILEADDRPLLDPFEPRLDAREIELRVRALVVRFDQLAVTAPSELADDVRSVGDALRALDETLADHGYDLGAAGDADADLSLLDAPSFEAVAVRIASYTEQVCRS